MRTLLSAPAQLNPGLSSGDALLQTAAHQQPSSDPADSSHSQPIFIYDDLAWASHTAHHQVDLSDLSHFPDRSKLAKSTKATAIYLSAYMVAHINVINARDFSHESALGVLIRRHLAPDYTAQIDNLGDFLPFDECNVLWAQLASLSPELSFEVLDIRADVNYPKGVATVYVHQVVTGWADAPRSALKALIQASWRLRRSGEWEIYRVCAMRSGGAHDGFGL